MVYWARSGLFRGVRYDVFSELFDGFALFVATDLNFEFNLKYSITLIIRQENWGLLLRIIENFLNLFSFNSMIESEIAQLFEAVLPYIIEKRHNW